VVAGSTDRGRRSRGRLHGSGKCGRGRGRTD
jgi:hypothetical protein